MPAVDQKDHSQFQGSRNMKGLKKVVGATIAVTEKDHVVSKTKEASANMKIEASKVSAVQDQPKSSRREHQDS